MFPSMTPWQLSPTEAERLSEALGGLPLAHEQAAAYCEVLEIDFAEYRNRFEAAPAKVLGAEEYSAPGYRDGQTTVAKTFKLAIEAANEIHPAAETLINHAALLAPKPIPLFFLSEGRSYFVAEAMHGLAGNGLEEALKALRVFALLNREQIADERDGAKKTETIRLHRLVRLVARECRRGTARDDVVRGLIGAMAHIYPRDVAENARSWPRARRLDPLAYGLVMRDGETLPGAEGKTSYLLNQLASYRMKATFAYQESEELFRAALSINERVFGEDHLRVASVLNNLASLLHTTGAHGHAEPLFRRSLKINETVYGSRDPRVAAILSNLAACLEKEDRFREAEMLYLRALEIDEEALGPNDRSVARDLSNIGEILRITNRLSEAEAFYRRALAITESDSSEDDPELATTLSNLATLLSDTNRFDEAEPLYRRALEIDERAFGPEHPEVATVLDLFGNCLRDANRLTEAKEMHQRALAIREVALGPEHPEVGLVVSNLGDTLRTIGDFDGAESHFRRAMAIFEKKLGPTHHKLASVLNNLGNILAETDRSPDAERLYRRALEIDEAIFGPDHPRISTDY
jgi:tetratricopeptide (TPR) repeat protein